MDEGDAAITRFRARLDALRPPTGGVSAGVIQTEVVPVLPLLAEIPLDDRVDGDFESFRFRDVLTVLTLFGRRLALLDLTPTSAVMVVDAALDAARGEGDSPTPAFDRHARVAAFEGFVRGREERVQTDADERARRPIRPLRIDEHTFALVVSGVHGADTLSECVDALGRAMLDADASAAIVEISQLGEPSRDRARAIFAADEVVRMLGGRCIFSGLDADWEAAAADAQVDLAFVEVTSSFSDAIAAARSAGRDDDPERRPSWRSLLGRLRR